MSAGPPYVSVLMPVYNGGERLAPAVQSVLSQVFTDFELIAVDDGSTDGSAGVLSGFAAADDRVRVLTHAPNRGLVASLNDGLAICRGELVARLDADDLAHPTRLERQVAAFASDPDLVLAATAYRRVDPAGNTLRVGQPPRTHAAFVGAMLAGNRICHSTVMFRRQVVVDLGGYRPEWFPVEDYDLWLRIARVGKYGALGSEEVVYLDNPVGISSTRSEQQNRRHAERATVEVSSWSGETQMPGTRELARAFRAIRADLRSRQLDDRDLATAVRSTMLGRLSGRSLMQRQLEVALRAPLVTLSAMTSRGVRPT